MTYTDDLLSAYLDKEISAGEIAAIEAALARDPDLRMRLEGLRRANEAVRDAYASIDREPLPGRVVSMLTSENNTDPVAAGVVVAFARKTVPMFARAWPGAMAASIGLVAGLSIGVYGVDHGPSSASSAIAQWSGDLPATSPLVAALNNSPSGEALLLDASGERFQSILSYQAENGDFCREFYISNDRYGVHGVACGADRVWRMEVTVRDGGEGGLTLSNGYRTASSESDGAIDAFVSKTIAGDVLDADSERTLMNRNWRTGYDSAD